MNINSHHRAVQKKNSYGTQLQNVARGLKLYSDFIRKITYFIIICKLAYSKV